MLRSLLSNVILAACLFAQGPGSGNGPGKPNDPTAGGIKRAGQSIDADGNKTSFEYTAKYDGKDYPVTGSDTIDMIALKRINDRTTEATLKKSGKVVSTARRVVSKDGKMLTLTITGTNAKGQKMKNIAVYDKQ